MKVERLGAEVKRATIELSQIEMQLSQSASKTSKVQGNPVVVQDASSEAWCKLQSLRAQLNNLVEDLERSKNQDAGGTLSDIPALQAACCQCHTEPSIQDENGPGDTANPEAGALELASIAIAVDLTSRPGIVHEIENLLADSVRTWITPATTSYRVWGQLKLILNLA